MVYIVAGLFAIFCIGIIVYVIRVYRSDKKEGYRFKNENDDSIRRR